MNQHIREVLARKKEEAPPAPGETVEKQVTSEYVNSAEFRLVEHRLRSRLESAVVQAGSVEQWQKAKATLSAMEELMSVFRAVVAEVRIEARK